MYPTQYKLGKTLITFTFSLSCWIEAGGDAVLSVEEAKEEATRHTDSAIQIFKEVSKVFLSDLGALSTYPSFNAS